LRRIVPPMSLKAKLEAVVYAAEEPVTLAQLATIFAAEVSLPETPEPATEQIPLEGLAAAAAVEEAPAEEAPALEGATSAVEDAAPVVEGTVPAVEDGSAKAEGSEGDEKKLARQRDRQIRQVLQQVMDELIAEYTNSERGMEIREIAGGYRMATKPEYHDAVRGFVKSLKPPMKLSLQALETLAVIAYKQPVTAPEVSEIRGVDSGGVLGSLVSRKLITTAGRKPVIGRPILYKTTKEFLLRFGLKDVNDLPSMEEFEKMAGELAESEAEGEAQDAGNLIVEDVATDLEPSAEAEQQTPEAHQAAPATEPENPGAEQNAAEAGEHTAEGAQDTPEAEREDPGAEQNAAEAEQGAAEAQETAQETATDQTAEEEAAPEPQPEHQV
jgi:segregation and condensation protein B